MSCQTSCKIDMLTMKPVSYSREPMHVVNFQTGNKLAVDSAVQNVLGRQNARSFA